MSDKSKKPNWPDKGACLYVRRGKWYFHAEGYPPTGFGPRLAMPPFVTVAEDDGGELKAAALREALDGTRHDAPRVIIKTVKDNEKLGEFSAPLMKLANVKSRRTFDKQVTQHCHIEQREGRIEMTPSRRDPKTMCCSYLPDRAVTVDRTASLPEIGAALCEAVSRCEVGE